MKKRPRISKFTHYLIKRAIMQALTAAISDFALTACKIGYSLLIYFANKMQRFSNTKGSVPLCTLESP